MTTRIQLRRGAASLWASRNPVLASAEIGVETDTMKGKVGDGATPWTDLPYSLVPDEQGSTLGRASIDGPNIAIDVTTHWGIGGDGPYYDSHGPTPGEEALMSFDHSTGELSWLLLSEVH